MLTLLLTVLACTNAKRDALLKEEAERDAWVSANERGGETLWPLPQRPPELRWIMDRQGDELQIAYQIFNPGDEPIWIFDEVEGDPSRLHVRRGEEATIGVVMKGVYEYYVCHYSYTTHWTYDVYARRVAPGEIVSGTGRQTLPLRSDVVSGARQVLTNPVEQIRLEIAWTMEDERYGPIFASPEQEPLVPTTPGLMRQRWLVSESLPLPD